MKARVAMFQRGLDSTWTTTWSQPQYTDEGDAWTIDGYMRITEWVDVEFPALAPEAIVPAQIAALDRQAEEVKAEFTAKLREIADARASLLALTHEVPHG